MTTTFTLQGTAGIPITADVQLFSAPVAGGTLHLVASRTPNGEDRALALTFQPSAISTGQAPASLATVGDGVLLAAALLGGLITRSGPTAAFTDTTDTAALIQAAWTGGAVGSSFEFTIVNTTAFAETLAGGTGVTLAGQTIIPPLSTGSFLAVWTGTNTITITNRNVVRNGGLAYAKTSSLNATTGILPAGALTGAAFVSLISTNALPGAQKVRTAAQMLADIPNGAVGMSWIIEILNTGAGDFTLTADDGGTVTLTGTMTVAQNTTRRFIATINTATTATIVSIGTGTYS